MDYISLGIAVLALGISIIAIRQTSSHRRGDRYVEVEILAQDCMKRLDDLQSRCSSLGKEWDAALAATGMYNSGLRQSVINDHREILNLSASLRAKLIPLTENTKALSNPDLDQRKIEIARVALGIDQLESRADESERKCRARQALVKAPQV